MSEIYDESHRRLQEDFDARPLADALEATIVADEVDAPHQAFIEARDMFFLATVDGQGRPTVSYKGGDPGFVRVIDPKTVVFPSYDGNGMFLSMGNIARSSEVGMLFIDFETPHRIRLQGRAEVSAEDPLLGSYPEAQLLVRVEVSKIWINCPRYIHRYRRVGSSKNVPRAGRATPLADWKRIDGLQDVLPPRDRGRAEAEGGLISQEEYLELVMKSES